MHVSFLEKWKQWTYDACCIFSDIHNLKNGCNFFFSSKNQNEKSVQTCYLSGTEQAVGYWPSGEHSGAFDAAADEAIYGSKQS